MSSLAAARADNFYYAPDFNPDVHKSLNKVRSSANMQALDVVATPPGTDHTIGNFKGGVGLPSALHAVLD